MENFPMSVSEFQQITSQILFEDNHLIILNKKASQIVQGDKTGDTPLCDLVKAYLKKKYGKPGDVFLGIPHRLDRPVSGVVVFTKTSKALSRVNKMIHDREFYKTYWAISKNRPPKEEDTLIHYLRKNEKLNKSFAFEKPEKDTLKAELSYRYLSSSDKYNLIEVELHTGRHHQIRVQLAEIGCIIKGDLKYGAERSNPDGSISLHARKLKFKHPVKDDLLEITAPVPKDDLWLFFEKENQS